jgi:hypothetical protein
MNYKYYLSLLLLRESHWSSKMFYVKKLSLSQVLLDFGKLMKSVESDRFGHSFKIQNWHGKDFETPRSVF